MKGFIVLLLLGFLDQSLQDVYCRDENNNPVDWYVLYKFPRLKTNSNPFLKKGNGYMFITSESLNDGWQISKNTIDGNSSILAKTLLFLNHTQQKQVLWFTYNDQGKGFCFTCGHTKGMVAGDKSGGIWLIHSIPRLIDHNYPGTGYRNAQSALCISLSQQELNSVGDLLIYNTPKFQRWNIAKELESLYPNIMAAFKKMKPTSPWTLTKSITTLNGNKIQAFAKAGPFHKDLYEWVASDLKTDLLVETWINELFPLPSSCKLNYRVINVHSMMIPKLNVTFSSHRDHSKIAISTSVSTPWVCIGDINRAAHQKKRGGGTYCLNNEKLWPSFRSLINSTKNCQ